MNNTGSTPMLETRDLKKHFKVGKDSILHAVDGVNIKIEKGQTLGVVGESGCGKSTLGRTVLRLLEPTSGGIYLDGECINNLKTKELIKKRRDMQMIFQDPYSSLNPRMNVRELIAAPMKINKMFRTKGELYDRVDELMEIAGLAPRLAGAYPHELDGGRRQRIGIARALAVNPKFIVCDEPVSALDVSIQAQILNFLMDLQDDIGLTYMFITHDLSVVKHISDEIAVMYLGQCVERAPVNKLFANPVHPYTKALLSAIPRPNLSGRDKPIEVIKGEVTSPINPKPGCRFASRCPYTSEKCMKEDIPFTEISDGHFCACILSQK